MTSLKAPIVVVRGGNKLSRLRTLILAYKFIYDRITTLSVIFLYLNQVFICKTALFALLSIVRFISACCGRV